MASRRPRYSLFLLNESSLNLTLHSVTTDLSDGLPAAAFLTGAAHLLVVSVSWHIRGM